jgi:predicted nucleic acid-binding protein
MMLYLDASALVKRYVAEMGSPEVGEAIAAAEMIATVIISRAEIAAALAKSVRTGRLTREDALASLQVFRREWHDFVRVQVTEMVVARADDLAWEHNLRGYDAVQLAAATLWQDAIGEAVTMATFDRQLWAAADQIGLVPYPTDLPRLLEAT